METNVLLLKITYKTPANIILKSNATVLKTIKLQQVLYTDSIYKAWFFIKYFINLQDFFLCLYDYLDALTRLILSTHSYIE